MSAPDLTRIAAALERLAGAAEALAGLPAAAPKVTPRRKAERRVRTSEVTLRHVRNTITRSPARPTPFSLGWVAETSGVHKSTVVLAVEELVRQGIVVEVEPTRRPGQVRGRPARAFTYNDPRTPAPPSAASLPSGRVLTMESRERRGGPPVRGTGRRPRARADVEALLEQVRAAGGVVSRSGSDHYIIRNPAGKKIGNCPATPSDSRALLNVRAKLKRNGLAV